MIFDESAKGFAMKKTIVIGAGFGGLALAIRLQAAGIPTLLLESRDKPGGRAYVYEDEGFTFDAGPTVITDPSAIESLFTLAGKSLSDYVALLPVTPFYRLCWETGEVFDYDNDQAKLEAQIRQLNPGDVEGYRRFLDYSRDVFREGYLKLGAKPFLSFRDMLKAAPQLTRLQAWRSVYSMVSSFIEDEHLRQAFSFHSLLVGGNPFSTSSIYTLIHALEREWGVWFPRGGTGALVRLFEDIGGELMLDARVERLETEGDRISAVTLANGRRLEARVAEQTAEARVTAAEAHLAQLDSTRRGEGEGARNIRFVLRAPMSGIVAESDATPGASVEEGARLFRIVALDRVHIVGSLPEAALSRVDELVGAELEVPGFGAPVALDRLIAVGRVLNPDTRTVPIIYELRNPDSRLAIGQAVSLRVFVSAATEAVTVPDSAIVDDAGQPVVFVQVAGESFERRAVELGNRESGLVQITGDVAVGERVVVRGAPFVRLAALSPQVPTHGHTH